MDFPESVVDFLKSTSFNDDIVVLERESHAAGRLAEVIAREDSADRNGNQSEYKLTPRQAENAARVALLLTRAFVDFGAQHMVTVELDNFFITSKSLGQRPALSDHHSQADGSIPPRSACAPPEHAGSSSEDAVQQKQGTDNVANDLKVILGIHVLFPTRMPDQERQQSQNGPAIPLQILGGLLYSIFTGGSLLTDTTFIENDVISDGDSSSKNRRTEGKSLFSRLSGGELFPTAICRLLSDLIDTDPSGKADSPYKSIPEVSEDLENLVDHPSIFLHDAQCPDGHWQPVFGNMLNGREEEIAAILKISTTLEQSLQKSYVGCPKFGVESIWLSGIAGAGKTHLVEAAGNFLTSVGWIFIKVKFERRKEHGSRAIFLSAFDELIIHVLKTKTKKDSADSSKKETFFSRVSNFIMKAIGQDTLKVLAGLLPSLKEMYNIDRKKRYRRDAEMPSWQLIYCLTKLLESVLESETFIMICFDDLQWADQTSLDLLKSIMSNVGNLKNSSRRCLFVGLFREDEVSDKHHLAIQRKNMQNSDNSVKVTDIKVSSLTRGHVEDMVMRGLRLPRRLVVGLADLVQKKTSGLPLFVVQFLNSLVKESIIVYSPTKRRYTWDEDRIDLIQTGDSVANLIASNLSSLPQLSQEALQILACFGMQTDSNLLRILEAPGSGFCGVTSSLRSLIDLGIIDEAGPIIRFTHDLIQQEVYENIPLDQRKALHLKLGNLLGSEAEADIDSSPDTQQATFDMDQLRLNDTFFAGRSMCSSLISIACDQINVSGPGLTNGDDQREKFIRWNLWAGQKSYRMSDYRAAMFYFSKGIDFIGVESWFRDTQCSNYRVYLQLHEGAVLASYELGKIDLRYANAVTDNVPFNDSLVVEQVLLKSISLQSGKHSECISKGVEILRKLGLDIPLSPTMSSVMNVVASTDIMTSRFDLEGIKTMCDEGADDSTRAILAIWDSFYVSAHVSNSPYLPLIACEVVKYSLEHKSICLESCTAFATYGVIKVAMGGNYAAGQKWAEVSRAIVKKTMEPDGSASNPKCDLILYASVDIYFQSPRDISQRLSNSYKECMKTGQLDCAMLCLQMQWRYLVQGGEKLSLINIGTKDTKRMRAVSPYLAKVTELDNRVLMQLTGKAIEPMYRIEDLRAQAEAAKDTLFLFFLRFNDFLLAFWKREDHYVEAEQYSHIALSFPSSKNPQLRAIYHTFYRGLVAFNLYRKLGGDGRLREGIETMDQVGQWVQNCNKVFESKWLLLKAEQMASSNDEESDAEELYMKSIEYARDQGSIHELALAFELLGSYYSTMGREMDSKKCFQKAYLYYNQWGATAVAEIIAQKYKVDVSEATKELRISDTKRSRQYD